MICSRALLDKYTNSVSLIDIVEEVTVQLQRPNQEEETGEEGLSSVPQPMPLRRYVVVTLFERSDPETKEKPHSRLVIRGPSGVLHRQEMSDIDLETSKRSRYFANLSALPVGGEGTYHFDMELRASNKQRWKRASRVSLLVREQTE